jgi:hypothetical protein
VGVLDHLSIRCTDVAAFARDPDGHNVEAVCHLPA